MSAENLNFDIFTLSLFIARRSEQILVATYHQSVVTQRVGAIVNCGESTEVNSPKCQSTE
ncbi:hypothetical protein AMR41_18620 [Hapalosiphon sp. MRB220]|nr:hypothetical protein AMR41_18620 [Hapalosiphon sp. MRB220]